MKIPDLREAEIENSKVVKIHPFEYVKSICTKVPLTEYQIARFNTDYQPFIVNRWLLANYPDEIIAINGFGDTPKRFHYEFLFKHTKKLPYTPKMTLKVIAIDKNIEMVSRFYRISITEAKMLYQYVGNDELQEIKKYYKNLK